MGLWLETTWVGCPAGTLGPVVDSTTVATLCVGLAVVVGGPIGTVVGVPVRGELGVVVIRT